jgi:hypothetical protein
MKIAIDFDDTVEFCRERDVEFYAVNKSFPEEVYDESISRKIDADLFIDDRNIGGFPGWSAVWQMLNPDDAEKVKELKRIQAENAARKKKKGLFRSR